MASAREIDPTGTQHRLERIGPTGRVTAHIAQLGASLRGLTVGGVDLVPPYPLGAPTPAASGIVLVPWPNRIRDGVWTQHGTTRSLAISEPAKNNAAHGLLRFAAYQPAHATADAAAHAAAAAAAAAADPASLTLEATVFPQTGYPFHLHTRVTYALTDAGIRVTHDIHNVGGDSAPVAVGAHPYVTLGDVDTADLVLSSPAATRFDVDDRMLPLAEVAVDAESDLRQGRRVGDLTLDTGFATLARDDDGRVRHSLTAPDGRCATLWAGPGFDYVQLFVTDRFPGLPLAVAIEPMTAPADAFNSGQGLKWLAPGERWLLEWGIELTDAPLIATPAEPTPALPPTLAP